MKRVSHLFGKALRETGQALDRVGLTVSGNEIFKETFSRHRPVMNIFDKRPVVANGVFIAPSASVIGEVLLYGGSSVFYGAVLRGDKNKIILGSNSNVQDRAVISTVPSLESGFPADVKIGEYVTIGHGALITSSTIGNRVLIGQGAIIEAGCVVEDQSMVAAGAVVLPGTLIKTGEMWAGNPAKFVRKLSEDETKFLEASAVQYCGVAKEHMEEYLPFGTAYQEAEKVKA